MTTLYKLDSKGKVRLWECAVTELPSGLVGISYSDGLEGGKMKDPTFTKAVPKNIGKSNETTSYQQAELMYQQEVDRKLRNGYYKTREEALATPIEFSPMLCPSGMKWDDYKAKIEYPIYVSPKLDGARCNAMLIDDKVVLKTRTGKVWKNCQHIADALVGFFKENPTTILDGEFYNHKYKNNFEDLMSIIKKEKPTAEDIAFSKSEVQYHIYDYYNSDNQTFSKRKDFLDNDYDCTALFIQCSSIKYCESKLVTSEEMFDTLHEKALKLGYEGTIVRVDSIYEPNKRSKHMLKRKDIYDLEATIVEIIEGEGTNAGICGKMTIKLDDGTIQEAGLGKGINHTYAGFMLEFASNFTGQRATFQYFGYTNGGKLRFPKFMRLRETLDC